MFIHFFNKLSNELNDFCKASGMLPNVLTTGCPSEFFAIQKLGGRSSCFGSPFSILGDIGGDAEITSFIRQKLIESYRCLQQ